MKYKNLRSKTVFDICNDAAVLKEITEFPKAEYLELVKENPLERARPSTLNRCCVGLSLRLTLGRRSPGHFFPAGSVSLMSFSVLSTLLLLKPFVYRL